MRPSEKLSISGFVLYSDITGFGADDDGEVWSYGAGVALPDFGKKGNLLGIFAGAQPYLGGSVAIAPITLKASTDIASAITFLLPLV